MAGGKLGRSRGKIQIVEADAVTSWSRCFAQYLDYLYERRSFTGATGLALAFDSKPAGAAFDSKPAGADVTCLPGRGSAQRVGANGLGCFGS